MAREEYPPGLEGLWRILPLLIIVAITIVAYANSFDGEFFFDDGPAILENSNIFHVWPPWRAVRLPNRWLVDISFAANYATGGFSPADYHVTNLLIHIMAAVLLFGVIHRTLALERFEKFFDGSGRWIALSVAALWAVHPLQTESVTYICQRFESMMGMFYFLTFYLFIRGTTAEKRGGLWLIAAAISWFIGMGTKIVLVTAPIMLMIYDWTFLSGTIRQMFRARWKFYLSLFVMTIVPAFIWLRLFQRTIDWDMPIIADMSPWKYLLTQAEVIPHYIRLSFVPYPLILDYRWEFVSDFKEVILPGLFVLALLLLTIVGMIKKHPLSFLGAWFFVILAPTSSFVPRAIAAVEHRMYLPLAAVIALVVIGVFAGLKRFFKHAAVSDLLIGLFGRVLFVIALAASVGLTTHRNEFYCDSVRMWADISNRRPDNLRARMHLCAAYQRRGDYASVEGVCEKMLNELPQFGLMTVEQIFSHDDEGFLIQANAYANAYDGLGVAAFARKDYEKAKRCFKESVRLSEGNPSHHVNLGLSHIMLGEDELAEGRWRFVIEEMLRKDITAHLHLANLLAKRGDIAEAVEHYKRFIQWRAEDYNAKLRLAWILATTENDEVRNGVWAVTLAHEVSEAYDHMNAEALDVLAAAHAESGDFDMALSAQQGAIKVMWELRGALEQDLLVELTEGMAERFKLYENKEPYRTSQPQPPAQLFSSAPISTLPITKAPVTSAP